MIPHNMMFEYYGQIDIWVDRIGLNFYGFSAVEAAAMEIPIITQIGADDQKWVPDCPFINTRREGVTEAIKTLATDSETRRSIGQASREYILKVHDSAKVAEQCLGIYKKLSNVNPY
jgi:glycosyltransferase involved in cell wall biosynthesis